VDPKTVFGNNVRRLRKQKGFSQEDLAGRSDLHRTYIGGVERGERNIALENIVAIATALECSVRELFAGIDPKQNIKRRP
jgi:transcriptional regulator with XRE-family HTH domain